MDKTRFQITDDIWLDARRAAWLPNAGVLAVADLHLGYAWASRREGQLLPVSGQDETINRLAALQKDYQPKVLAVLGDIVQRALPIPQLREEFDRLFASLSADTTLVLIQGNHDKNLSLLMESWKFPVQLLDQYTAEHHLLVHGDGDATASASWKKAVKAKGARILMGHEHPATVIGDGVASWAKCPCFLVSEKVIILPAFSTWAAGTIFPRYPFMSPLAQSAHFTQAFAILADKLLPLPFGR
jgi:putative SbcD/Mre11-related phosphoesterase